MYRPTTAEPPPREPPAALEMPEWVAQLAHDIRSPLTSMLFLVQSLRDRQSGSLDEIQERQIALLYGAVFNLSSIANDVIEMSRAGSHRLIGPEPVVFSMSEVLHCVREIVLPITEERGIELHVVTPAADLRIGHPLALSRILLNLTVNALRFTQHGSVELSIRAHDGNRVECAVTDTGPGMSPALLATLGHSGQSPLKAEGHWFASAGLGVAVCRQLVTALGSELRIDSREGVGSRFWFVLDLAPAPSAEVT
jgi:signal transduction histidine kinase